MCTRIQRRSTWPARGWGTVSFSDQAPATTPGCAHGGQVAGDHRLGRLSFLDRNVGRGPVRADEQVCLASLGEVHDN